MEDQLFELLKQQGEIIGSNIENLKLLWDRIEKSTERVIGLEANNDI